MSLRAHAWPAAALTFAVALASGCSAAGSSIGGNAVHGQAVAHARCASCHGADGNSAQPTIPRLAGQKAGYLYRQLAAFKDGVRPSSVMAAIVAPLPDEDLRDAARFYAGQAPGHDNSGAYDLMAEGRRIYLDGSADGRFPACASCHAPGAGGMGPMGGGMGMGHMSMMGMMGARNAPLLYGQHAAYTVGQLHAFADGTRPAMMMGRIAAGMTPRQAKAVADYLAAHP